MLKNILRNRWTKLKHLAKDKYKKQQQEYVREFRKHANNLGIYDTIPKSYDRCEDANREKTK